MSFEDLKKADEKKALKFLIIVGAATLLALILAIVFFSSSGKASSGFGKVVLILLGIVFIAGTLLGAVITFKAVKAYLYVKKKPVEAYKPLTAEQKKAAQKSREEKDRAWAEYQAKEALKRYSDVDASGALYSNCLQTLLNELCRKTEGWFNKGNGIKDDAMVNRIKLNVYALDDFKTGKYKYRVEAKCSYVFLAHWMDKYYNTTEPVGNVIDQIKAIYGDDLGFLVAHDEGLIQEWHNRYHSDVRNNINEGEKGLQRFVKEFVLTAAIDHAKKFKGVNFDGQVRTDYYIDWKLKVD